MDEIDALVRKAHVNVLPSMNNTGVKLKLLNALFNGRFCVTNTKGVKGSRITKGVTIYDNPEDWINGLSTLFDRPFSTADKKEREEVVQLYNNNENAQRLTELWSHCR